MQKIFVTCTFNTHYQLIIMGLSELYGPLRECDKKDSNIRLIFIKYKHINTRQYAIIFISFKTKICQTRMTVVP